MTALDIEHLGEDALLLRVGDGIDASLNARVHALAASIQAHRPRWLLDVVPAQSTLALFVDVDLLDAEEPLRAETPLDRAEGWLRALALDPAGQSPDGAALEPAVIPVAYGGDFGPDLEAIATRAGLTPDEAIRLHAGGGYRVAMLGFAPGFPYLNELDARLAAPRRTTPRVRVAGGSVGIGGAQTGIYPREGPGGWNIIGRTPLRLFDPMRESPCLLAPGQRVRFQAIEEAEFRRLEAGQ